MWFSGLEVVLIRDVFSKMGVFTSEARNVSSVKFD